MDTPAPILIVDDHAPNLVAFRAVLEPLEVEIVTVRSGREALQHAETKDFAVVLLDVQMADMDGFETAAALKRNERSRSTPVIFLTASVADSQRVRGYQQGGVDYLFKPVDTDVLRTKVAVFVELFRSREEMKRQAALLSERERDEARSKLKLTDERLASILSALSEGIVVQDREGQIVFVNDAAPRLLGLSMDEMLGRTVADARFQMLREDGSPLPGDERPTALVVRTGVPQHDVVVGVNHPDGRLVWISVTALPRFDPVSKQMVGVVASYFDVTERKAAQAAALESERQFRILADSIPQLAWIAEPDGSIHWYNQRWYEYTGATLSEMESGEGWGWQRVHHPDHVERVVGSFQRAISSEHPWEDTFPLRRKDGEYRWHLTRAMPLRDAAGKVVRWFGTNTDVENERRQATELRDALQARDIFLSVASHELKTPLTPLSLRLTQLKHEATHRAAIDPAHVKTLRTVTLIESQVKKLGQLVDGLLDVSRLAQGHFSLAPSDGDIALLLREVVSSMEPQADKVGSTVRVKAPETVPALVDSARLSQVITNLLSNALKFGAGKPVDVSLTANGRTARLIIKDEGIGIPAEFRERIFERFERAVSERHYGGMGLGLWLARQIVEAMGGCIAVQSESGAGASFTVDLPLSPEAK